MICSVAIQLKPGIKELVQDIEDSAKTADTWETDDAAMSIPIAKSVQKIKETKQALFKGI